MSDDVLDETTTGVEYVLLVDDECEDDCLEDRS